jgi:hypothetical protein
LKECQHVPLLQLAAEHDIAFHINTVNQKHRLCDIETDRVVIMPAPCSSIEDWMEAGPLNFQKR